MNPNDPTADPFHDCSGCGRSVPECECDEGDGDGWEDECPDCGLTYCICDSDDRDRDLWDDAMVTLTRRDAAEYHRDMAGCGNLDAIARKMTRHGVGLGGYPWQKRASRRRGMQARRRWDRRHPSECPEHKGGECPADCWWAPF